jgi:6-pyruvoyltetrahydropterin/6-carboxytetrahydropterin synthase
MSFESTKVIDLGSCAFRQWRAGSHCRFIHGYRLTAKFWFNCDELDGNHWVMDFGGLKQLKDILERQFDHTLCVSADDPELLHFQKLHELKACDLRIMPNGVGIERTAEWCFNAADEFVRKNTGDRCWVSKVEVWEHEKNSALYIKKDSCCKNKTQYTSKVEQIEIQPAQQSGDKNDRQSQIINEPIPTRIGNQVSSGWSNPFAGTSWGV